VVAELRASSLELGNPVTFALIELVTRAHLENLDDRHRVE
jgi:hypothetical protein